MRTSLLLGALALLAGGVFAAGGPQRDIRHYVSGGEARDLKTFGAPWQKVAGGVSFPKGVTNRWSTTASIGPGNFSIKAKMCFQRLTFCDMMFRLGGGDHELIFDFEDIGGSMYLAGSFIKANLLEGRIGPTSKFIRHRQPFAFEMKREGDQLMIFVDGREIFRRWLETKGLGPLTITNARGEVTIEELSVEANFVAYEEAALTNVDSLRNLEWLPVCTRKDAKNLPLGPFAKLPDGGIVACENNAAHVTHDGGRTWRSHPLFTGACAGKFSQTGEGSIACANDGTLVYLFYNRKEDVWKWNYQTQRPLPECRLPTYVIRSTDGGQTWSAPEQLPDRYGAHFGSAIVTKKGTILVMSQDLDFAEGRNVTHVYRSADNGQTWTRGPALDWPGEHGDHAGLIEGTVIELKDGRIRALLRSYHGVFHEAYSSDDGLTWGPLPPPKSNIATTGSPGVLTRLSDGSQMLTYNAIPSEGFARREELHVAFSSDDGVTWTKPLVIARFAGARIAYPAVVEPRPGVVWITTAQGNWRAEVPLSALKQAKCGF